MNPEDFLIDLLKIKSYSGEETEIGDYLIRRLEKNFKIVKQEIGNSFNLFAYVGEPKLVFSAHLDTVGGDLQIWKDSKFVYGRGSSDDKGQIVAIILAAERAIKRGIDNFGLLFTVREEDDLEGAKKAVKIIPKSVKMIILGESTNLNLVSSHRGFIDFKIICRGRSAHASTPELGINAIELLIKELEKLKQLKFEEDKNLMGNVLNIGKISGGVSPGVVPDYAEAEITIRNSVSSDKIINKIKKNIKAEIKIIGEADPVISEGAEELAREIGVKSIVVPYFTEAYYLSKCAKTFVIGAGDINDAHTDMEKISIKELNSLIDLYFKIMEKEI